MTEAETVVHEASKMGSSLKSKEQVIVKVRKRLTRLDMSGRSQIHQQITLMEALIFNKASQICQSASLKATNSIRRFSDSTELHRGIPWEHMVRNPVSRHRPDTGLLVISSDMPWSCSKLRWCTLPVECCCSCLVLQERIYVPRVLCSQGPMFPCLKSSYYATLRRSFKQGSYMVSHCNTMLCVRVKNCIWD